ncbi:hypothetical protein D3C83_242140 [compost metagenome]
MPRPIAMGAPIPLKYEPDTSMPPPTTGCPSTEMLACRMNVKAKRSAEPRNDAFRAS